MTNFGVNIKKIRNLKNYTQQHLGDILGLTRAAVSSYEEGRAEPKIETLVRASQIFGVSVDDLINKKLTINELSNFKIPDITPASGAKQPATSLFPAEAAWHSTDNAIIIDNRFHKGQILLAIPDRADHTKPQLIFTGEAVYVAGEKTISADAITAGPHRIPLAAIKSTCTILGVYHNLAEITGLNIQAELRDIKNRLEVLEKSKQNIS